MVNMCDNSFWRPDMAVIISSINLTKKSLPLDCDDPLSHNINLCVFSLLLFSPTSRILDDMNLLFKNIHHPSQQRAKMQSKECHLFKLTPSVPLTSIRRSTSRGHLQSITLSFSSSLTASNFHSRKSPLLLYLSLMSPNNFGELSL